MRRDGNPPSLPTPAKAYMREYIIVTSAMNHTQPATPCQSIASQPTGREPQKYVNASG
jgi:hypothetical protein